MSKIHGPAPYSVTWISVTGIKLPFAQLKKQFSSVFAAPDRPKAGKGHMLSIQLQVVLRRQASPEARHRFLRTWKETEWISCLSNKFIHISPI